MYLVVFSVKDLFGAVVEMQSGVSCAGSYLGQGHGSPASALASKVCLQDRKAIQVLVVEDDALTRRAVVQVLRRQGCEVAEAENAELALGLSRKVTFQAVILDILLPGMDGFELCQRLREQGETVAILIYTSLESVTDRIHGLDLGADDYLIKPVDPGELVARLNAVLRRLRAEKPVDVIVHGGFQLDLLARSAFKDGRRLDLAAREFTLLAALMSQPGMPMSREELFRLLWGATPFRAQKALDVCVCRLREKIESVSAVSSCIQTVRGIGYVCL